MTATQADLEAIDEWNLSRATGNTDIEHEKAVAMVTKVRQALVNAERVQGLITDWRNHLEEYGECVACDVVMTGMNEELAAFNAGRDEGEKNANNS